MYLIGAGPSGSLSHPPPLYQGEQPLGTGTGRGVVTGAVCLDSMSTCGQGHTETHPICVSAHRSSLPRARCPENTGREAGAGQGKG